MKIIKNNQKHEKKQEKTQNCHPILLIPENRRENDLPEGPWNRGSGVWNSGSGVWNRGSGSWNRGSAVWDPDF